MLELQEVVDAIRTARPLILGNGARPQLPSDAVSLDATLLLRALVEVGDHPRPVFAIAGAWISKTVDLNALRTTAAVNFRECTLAGGLYLSDAHLGSLTLNACVVQPTPVGSAIEAPYLHLDHGLALNATTANACIHLRSARIGGQLSIVNTAVASEDGGGWSLVADGLQVGAALFIEGDRTRCEGGLRLNGARIDGQLSIRHKAIVGADKGSWSLDADGLQAGGGLIVEGEETCCEGGLRLLGARIDGQLSISDGAVVAADESKWSLNADGLQVAGNLVVDGEGTRCEGGLRLTGARIDGQLHICKAIVGADMDSWSLKADGLQMGDGLVVGGEGTCCEGGLRLLDARTVGQLRISDGAVVAAGENQWSLLADGMQVADLFVGSDGTCCAGGLRLVGAHVTGQLSIRNKASVAAGTGNPCALQLQEARVGTLSLGAASMAGAVDLSDTEIRLLRDSPQVWHLGHDPGSVDKLASGAPDGPAAAATAVRWHLDRVSIAQLTGPGEGFSVKDRLDWLRRTGGAGDRSAPRDVYRTVASAYRRGGCDDEALEVLGEMRRRHDPPLLRWLLAPIGQGYKPHWALAGLVVIWIIVAGVVWWAASEGAFVSGVGTAQVASNECVSASPVPCLQPGLYAADTVAPVLNLGHDSTWSPATSRGARSPKDLLAWFLALGRLVGATFTGLVVLGALRLVLDERNTS